MSKILVTGASGNLGRKTLLSLLKKRPASELVGMARDLEKVQDLIDLGIEIRQGDYFDKESLRKAFKGIDKLMLIGATAFSDRNAAHANAIDAAVSSGIKHLVFMTIMRKTNIKVREVTEEDKFAEKILKESGLTYTLVQHPPFLEVMPFFFGMNGIRVPEGQNKIAAASQDDLAEAHAVVLTKSGHEKKTYILNGSPAVSPSEMADILKVPYEIISHEAFVKNVIANNGIPEIMADKIAEFVDGWAKVMSAGGWDYQTNDLEKLIGHAPQSMKEFLQKNKGDL